MKSVSFTNYIPSQQQCAVIVPVFGSLLLLSVAFYMYFLSMSVVHVVLQKETSHKIDETKTQITSLEEKYIDAQHTISDRIANVENFADTSNKIFVRRDAHAVAYSRN